MNLNLRGKVAIVTGVSSTKVRMGLGAAISEVLAQEGVNVAANYIVDGEDVLEFAEYLNKKYAVKCTALYGDVSKPGDIDVISASFSNQGTGFCADNQYRQSQ